VENDLVAIDLLEEEGADPTSAVRETSAEISSTGAVG
jgi:hypothetical protein